MLGMDSMDMVLKQHRVLTEYMALTEDTDLTEDMYLAQDMDLKHHTLLAELVDLLVKGIVSHKVQISPKSRKER